MHKTLRELFLSFDPNYNKDDEETQEAINELEVIEDDEYPLGI
jgi:hypothetical protein|tara:strand:- start:504 stop:632 length:129 start_codon:yes stop_codon:yes gene_type:complete